MTKLENSIILITGAGGGFGQEFIKQLLQKGSRLILTDIDEKKLLSQLEIITSDIKTGEIIDCLKADLSTNDQCKQLYKKVQSSNLPIDILINNAGMGLYGRMDEVPTEEWEKLMQVNLLSPMALSSLFVKDMIHRQKGHIVNISSLAGWIALAGMAHYASSKFGLRGFSEGLSKEVKPYNIKVTAVYPFFSRTPILQSKAYGTFAQNYQGFPVNFATNPDKIIKTIIQGILKNKSHIFPDQPSKIIHLFKKFFN